VRTVFEIIASSLRRTYVLTTKCTERKSLFAMLLRLPQTYFSVAIEVHVGHSFSNAAFMRCVVASCFFIGLGWQRVSSCN
jgi:hypothetical protein